MFGNDHNSKMPLVSIILTAHQDVGLLIEAITSVTNQSYTNFECIIVLDGDGEQKLTNAATSVIERDGRFVVITVSQRRERNYCRNLGISLARGDFICFLDGDDLLPENSLLSRVQYAVNKNEPAVHGGLQIMHRNKIIKSHPCAPRYNFERLSIAWPHHCSLLIHKEFLKDVRYPASPGDLKVKPALLAGEDVDFMHRLLLANGRSAAFVSCGEPVYCYRRHISSSYQARHESILRVIDRLICFHGVPKKGARNYLAFAERVSQYAIWFLVSQSDLSAAVSKIRAVFEKRGISKNMLRDCDLLNIFDQVKSDLAAAEISPKTCVALALERLQTELLCSEFKKSGINDRASTELIRKSEQKTIVTYPPLSDKEMIRDTLWRAAWHFSYLNNIEIVMLLNGNRFTLFNADDPPSNFHFRMKDSVHWKRAPIRFYDVTSMPVDDIISQADILLELESGSLKRDAINAKGKKIYKVDPVYEKNEGSFYIQAALDLESNHQRLIQDSEVKFMALAKELGVFKTSWILATGPSVEEYKDFNFDGQLVIVCNSVVFNEDLLTHVNPDILVFADPIFHFGVSRYAGEFREVMEKVVKERDLWVIVPFKYYPLLVAVCPAISERVVGVPMRHRDEFNLDLCKEFEVKITSNILTLLMLPLASTLSNRINLLGCDGRPVDECNYFWGHGKSVQNNKEMENIQQVHPGFFRIDYNDYYFTHCHTLANLIEDSERLGNTITHQAHSYIPALSARSYDHKRRYLGPSLYKPSEVCVVLEPDGIGTEGHYVAWHNSLTKALGSRYKYVFVLCNRKQDPSNYEAVAFPTFRSSSWYLSRNVAAFDKGYSTHKRIIEFRSELREGLRRVVRYCGKEEVALFLYYGSTQLVRVIEEVRVAVHSDRIYVKPTVTLFFEGVNLGRERFGTRFPPDASESLMRAVANDRIWTLCSVTSSLSEEVERKLGVRTKVLPNPPPNPRNGLPQSRSSNSSARGKRFTVIFPGDGKIEKGVEEAREFVRLYKRRKVLGKKVAWKIKMRKSVLAGIELEEGIVEVGDNLSWKTYVDMLRDSDVAVLPYLAPQFKYRTSGILAEVLEARLPIVCISGTWVAEQVWKLRAGLVVNYYSPISLWSAISVVEKNYDWFQDSVDTAWSRYSKDNSWDRVVNLVEPNAYQPD